MKAFYRTRDGRMSFELEAEDAKGIFRLVATVQMVFEADSACRVCGSTSLRYNVRNYDVGEYFELVCNNCNAKLQFGQHRKGGTLCPKRDPPNSGWHKWSEAEEEAS